MRVWRISVSVILLLITYIASAQPAFLSIVIDDMGNNPKLDRAVAALPGAVTCAVLPNAKHSRHAQEVAFDAGKEIMVHAPMQAISKQHLGPGGLRLEMDKEVFLSSLREHLLRVPYASGVNNHMGSLLTQSSTRMQWLMSELKDRHMYFVDSFTIAESVAGKVATQAELPTTTRNVFLDNKRDYQKILDELMRAIALAKKQGSALAIGHPNKQTIAVLRDVLPELSEQGVELVAVSELIHHQQHTG